ncbi:DUF4145 domain-containing protein [Actinomyces oris]|jgi:hypothetical protein|uniref:DUF4145 domain-containing protein n=1 Tax=Actinomyces oris TaxID=544580 RepID=UPI0028D8EC45|nr:DUF4145 domain-containing protein [Actinomyces oris]
MTKPAEHYDTLKSLMTKIDEKDRWPRPTCPACNWGHIIFETPESFLPSRALQPGVRNPDDDDLGSGTFTITGHCNNDNCEQPIHGVGGYTSYPDDEFSDFGLYSGTRYFYEYKLNYLYPSLQIIDLPKGTPEQVKESVQRASGILFTDINLAATALRVALEKFLTTENIGSISSQGNYLSTHRRIEAWCDADPTPERTSIANLFLAAKWIGNEGTHENASLGIDEFLNGAKYLEEAFHLLFTSPTIQDSADFVNRSRKP